MISDMYTLAQGENVGSLTPMPEKLVLESSETEGEGEAEEGSSKVMDTRKTVVPEVVEGEEPLPPEHT
jgi:hypothetical protein